MSDTESYEEQAVWPPGVEEMIEEAHAEESRLAGRLYEKAAILGGPAVYLEAGDRFENDDNLRKAIEYFRSAADGGCYFGFARAASVYFGERNYADEARCWRKFVAAYVRDTNPRKAESSSSTGFLSPLKYFCEEYLAGRFHVSGTSLSEFAMAQIEKGEPRKEWIIYVQRGRADDSLVALIAAELLGELNKKGEGAYFMGLGDAALERAYLERLV